MSKKIDFTSIVFTNRNANVNRYFSDINHIAEIDDNTMHDLYERAWRGDRAARNKIVSQNLKVVISLAKKFEWASTLQLNDLINEGNIGLIFAASTYDPSEGTKFITYATMCVYQHILQAIREYGKVVKMPRQTTNEDYFSFSLDAPIGTDEDGNEVNLYDKMESGDCADKTADSDTELIITTLLKTITNERNRQIIGMLYGIGCRQHSMWEVAQKAHCSEENVRLIKIKVLKELSKFSHILDM